MTLVEKAPWMIPVPLRSSEFVALQPQHTEFNIEVDFSGIRAFGTAADAAQHELLMCDLQSNPDTSVRGRLGAGRAGFYRGSYVKGVGRTSLAANWAFPEDARRSTGYMRPSAALRELLVSAYLRAKQCVDLINPCDGILLKPLSVDTREDTLSQLKDIPGFASSTSPNAPSAPNAPNAWAGDAKLQALTIKPGGFARFSNFVWLANRIDFYDRNSPLTTSLVQFLRLFLTTLEPDRADAAHDAAPDAIAEAFFRSFDRSLEMLRRSWLLGVSWSSLHNNIAVDGRFLDIEVPIVLGHPLLGCVLPEATNQISPASADIVWGFFEPFAFALHMRMVVWFFTGKFDSISTHEYPVLPPEREYAKAIADAMRVLAKDHVLFSESGLKSLLERWVDASAIDLSGAQRQSMRAVMDTVYRAFLTADRTPKQALSAVPFEGALARMSLRGAPIPHRFDFVDPKLPLLSEEGAFMNERWRELDQIGDRDTLLAKTLDALSAIQKYVTPARHQLF